MSTVHVMFSGALVALSLVAALFFLRCWRITGDRFFLLFAAAFVGMSINWSVIATIAPTAERQHWAYVIRLVAFLLILAAIVDKNRSERG